MTAKAEMVDGDITVDPDVIRALLRFRESVAEATALACRELRAAGIDDPARVLLSRWLPSKVISRS